MISAVPVSSTSRRSSARICAWIVTSSAVVGSSAMSSRGRQASAIAISARCRIPPESWCGYSLSRRLGSGMPTDLSSPSASTLAALPLHPAVPLQHLGDLQPDRDHRVQRGERVLEDHAHVAAAAVPHLPVGEPQQVGALERHLAGDRVAALGQQPHDRQRRHGLAATGLADQADGLAGLHREAHAVDGRERFRAAPVEDDLEVADVEQCHRDYRRFFGSRASRSDSPSSVKPSATTTMARPG